MGASQIDIYVQITVIAPLQMTATPPFSEPLVPLNELSSGEDILKCVAQCGQIWFGKKRRKLTNAISVNRVVIILTLLMIHNTFITENT